MTVVNESTSSSSSETSNTLKNNFFFSPIDFGYNFPTSTTASGSSAKKNWVFNRTSQQPKAPAAPPPTSKVLTDLNLILNDTNVFKHGCATCNRREKLNASHPFNKTWRKRLRYLNLQARLRALEKNGVISLNVIHDQNNIVDNKEHENIRTNSSIKSEFIKNDAVKNIDSFTDNLLNKSCLKGIDAIQLFTSLRHTSQALKLMEESIIIFNNSELVHDNIKLIILKLKIVEDTPQDIAYYLLIMEGLNPVRIGEYLGHHSERSQQVLKEYLLLFNFNGLGPEQALRFFLSRFYLPGESQIVYRVLEEFSLIFVRFLKHTEWEMLTSEQILKLSYALLMLNTSRHNPTIQRSNKMTKGQFLLMCSTAGLSDSMPLSYIEGIYDNLVLEQLTVDASWTEVCLFYNQFINKQIDRTQHISSNNDTMCYHESDIPCQLIPSINNRNKLLNTADFCFQCLQEGTLVRKVHSDGSASDKSYLLWIEISEDTGQFFLFWGTLFNSFWKKSHNYQQFAQHELCHARSQPLLKNSIDSLSLLQLNKMMGQEDTLLNISFNQLLLNPPKQISMTDTNKKVHVIRMKSSIINQCKEDNERVDNLIPFETTSTHITPLPESHFNKRQSIQRLGTYKFFYSPRRTAVSKTGHLFISSFVFFNKKKISKTRLRNSDALIDIPSSHLTSAYMTYHKPSHHTHSVSEDKMGHSQTDPLLAASYDSLCSYPLVHNLSRFECRSLSTPPATTNQTCFIYNTETMSSAKEWQFSNSIEALINSCSFISQPMLKNYIEHDVQTTCLCMDKVREILLFFSDGTIKRCTKTFNCCSIEISYSQPFPLLSNEKNQSFHSSQQHNVQSTSFNQSLLYDELQCLRHRHMPSYLQQYYSNEEVRKDLCIDKDDFFIPMGVKYTHHLTDLFTPRLQRITIISMFQETISFVMSSDNPMLGQRWDLFLPQALELSYSINHMTSMISTSHNTDHLWLTFIVPKWKRHWCPIYSLTPTTTTTRLDSDIADSSTSIISKTLIKEQQIYDAEWKIINRPDKYNVNQKKTQEDTPPSSVSSLCNQLPFKNLNDKQMSISSLCLRYNEFDNLNVSHLPSTTESLSTDQWIRHFFKTYLFKKVFIKHIHTCEFIAISHDLIRLWLDGIPCILRPHIWALCLGINENDHLCNVYDLRMFGFLLSLYTGTCHTLELSSYLTIDNHQLNHLLSVSYESHFNIVDKAVQYEIHTVYFEMLLHFIDEYRSIHMSQHTALILDEESFLCCKMERQHNGLYAKRHRDTNYRRQRHVKTNEFHKNDWKVIKTNVLLAKSLNIIRPYKTNIRYSLSIIQKMRHTPNYYVTQHQRIIRKTRHQSFHKHHTTHDKNYRYNKLMNYCQPLQILHQTNQLFLKHTLSKQKKYSKMISKPSYSMRNQSNTNLFISCNCYDDIEYIHHCFIKKMKEQPTISCSMYPTFSGPECTLAQEDIIYYENKFRGTSNGTIQDHFLNWLKLKHYLNTNQTDNQPMTLAQCIIAICQGMAILFPSIGFIPGQEALVAYFLTIYSVENAFLMLGHLFYSPNFQFFQDISCLGKAGKQRIRLRIEFFNELITLKFPDLATHFTFLTLSPELFFIDWISSFFVKSFIPVSFLPRVWDLIFLFGEVVLFSLALSLLSFAKRRLLKSSFSQSIALLLPNLQSQTERSKTYKIDEDLPSMLSMSIDELIERCCTYFWVTQEEFSIHIPPLSYNHL